MMLFKFNALFGLGWVRLLLSLMVFDAHYWVFRTHIYPHLLKHIHSLDRSRAPGMGALAVIGFFVISGYAIALVLNRKNEYKNDLGILVFYLNRIFRIYPLFCNYSAPPPGLENRRGILTFWGAGHRHRIPLR